MNYHTASSKFPPGVYQLSFATAPKFRGVTLYVYLLPYLEQDNLAQGWDMTDPLNNTVGANLSRTATVLKMLVCPSDQIPINPVNSGSGGRWYGMTSYGGNGGSRSYDPQFATNDGIFAVIGPGSQTAPSGVPVRITDVTDGLSNTVLFGERSHVDLNHDSFATNLVPPSGQFINPMSEIGWWASSGGRLASGDVTLSAYAPINYKVPIPTPRPPAWSHPCRTSRPTATTMIAGFAASSAACTPAAPTSPWAMAPCVSSRTRCHWRPCRRCASATMAPSCQTFDAEQNKRRGIHREAVAWPLAATLVLTLAGCSQVERGELTGVVRKNGHPLGNVLVSFVPDAEARSKAVRAAGVTDEKGRFHLRSEDRQRGVVVGPYRVVIEDLAVHAAPRSADGTVLKLPPERVPVVYRDPLRTPLRREVTAGAQQIEIDLTDGK